MIDNEYEKTENNENNAEKNEAKTEQNITEEQTVNTDNTSADAEAHDDAVKSDTEENKAQSASQYTRNQQYTYGSDNTPSNTNQSTTDNRTYNPYFSGYGNAQNTSAQNNTEQNTSAQNGSTQNSYAQNGSAQNGSAQNGSAQNGGVRNGQHTYGTNPSEQRPTGYYSPYGNNGQNRGNGISYTPNPGSSQKQKKKKSKGISSGAVAALLVATMILGCAAGFGGAMLASHMGSSSESENSRAISDSTSDSSSDEGMVVYRSVDVEDVTTSVNDGEEMTYAQVAAAVKDSVVEINTEYTTQSLWFQYVSQGAGSGVIISKDGYIITNAHVILNESTSTVADDITVRLTDGSEYKAEVKSYDSDADIAILKVEAENLSAAVCGDSDKLATGEEVIVVGNPLGQLGGSVTNGIVSATEREIDVNGVEMTLIQTNAAVNPGNSGGGMFNMKGQLIGIVNAKSSGTEIEGIGFAIPINRALEVSEQLLTYGYVRGKVMIGVTFQDVSNSNYFYYYNIKAGVYVAELTAGYNDDVLEVGDRIIAVNGEEVTSYSDIKSIVSSCSVGDKLKFQLYRDNKLMEVEVTCYEKVPTDSNIEFNADADESSIPGSLSDFFN